jgi:hypothetical protein
MSELYMLVAGSGSSDVLDTEGGLVRVRLIVVWRFMFGKIVCGESVGGFTGYVYIYIYKAWSKMLSILLLP